MINNDTIWTNIHGQTKSFKDLDDKHLANLVHWLEHYYGMFAMEQILILNKIRISRGLSDEFMKNAPYSYINRDRNEEIWDYDLNAPILLKDKS